jgi:hypothetical protein
MDRESLIHCLRSPGPDILIADEGHTIKVRRRVTGYSPCVVLLVYIY